jgi:hypothetical protein
VGAVALLGGVRNLVGKSPIQAKSPARALTTTGATSIHSTCHTTSHALRLVAKPANVKSLRSDARIDLSQNPRFRTILRCWELEDSENLPLSLPWAFAPVFLVVIPEGNLLLPLPAFAVILSERAQPGSRRTPKNSTPHYHQGIFSAHTLTSGVPPSIPFPHHHLQFFSSKTAQKSHVKSQNHLTPSNKRE